MVRGILSKAHVKNEEWVDNTMVIKAKYIVT